MLDIFRQSLQRSADALATVANALSRWSAPPSVQESQASVAQTHEPPMGQPVPYDENLLERSRSQWQFGDWESLASIERDTLQHHPDRAKLALLAAAGHLQLGNVVQGRQMLRLAEDWGCSRQLLARVLIAGVHNSLGKASTLCGEDERALSHFHQSVRIGTPGVDAALMVKARQDLQREQLSHSARLTDAGEILPEQTDG
jgi:hypothetical protein